MAYDEGLAARVRVLVGEHGAAEEKPMFGGLGFMLEGYLAVGADHQGGLLVRCRPDESADLLAQEHVAPMVMGARSSRTWLRVAPDALASDEQLARWVGRAVATVRSLPARR